jgi:dUTP pyrophosphatase
MTAPLEIQSYDPFYVHGRISKPIAGLVGGVSVKLLGPQECLPAYATDGSVGMDLRANIDQPLEIGAGEVVRINTGIALHIHSQSIGAFIYPRSGLGSQGLVLANLVGVIDSDYQGEIMVALWNRNDSEFGDPIVIKPLDRIAQLVFQPIVKVSLSVVDEFAEKTTRGAGGFGSTGR